MYLGEMELLMPIEQGRPFDTWDLSTIKEELFSRRAIHNMHLDQVSKSSLEQNELSRIYTDLDSLSCGRGKGGVTYYS